MRAVSFAVAGLMVMFAEACGSSDEPLAAQDEPSSAALLGDGGSAGPTRSAADAALVEDADAGARCTELPQRGKGLTGRVTHAAAPSAKGGVIRPGVYVKTAALVHTDAGSQGAPVASHAETWRLTTDRYEVVLTSEEGERRSAGSYTILNELVITLPECEFPARALRHGTFNYDATETELTVWISVTEGILEVRLLRQE